MRKPKLLPKPQRKVAPKRVTLANRKTCYAKPAHRMSEDNVFHYMGGTWCRRCRADSRLRSRHRRAAEFKAREAAKRKEAKAALAGAFSTNGKRKAKANGKVRTARKAATVKAAA